MSDNEEERISKLKAIELFGSGKLDALTPGTFKTLAEIHKNFSLKFMTSQEKFDTLISPKAISDSFLRFILKLL